MFAPATQQQQQQQQQQKQKLPLAAATAEEEALKRNTDCVYFLASPLTCKKGSECEYRHSEYARVNPRDCYYWLNGNCLNPKCGFRHPPLDGLLGNQGGAPAGPVNPTHAQAPHVGKQAVPCVFFRKGMCIKGDRCAFLHVPTSAASKTQQQPVEPKPAAEPQPSKKPFEKVTEEKKFPSAKFSKAVKAHVDAGAAPKVTNAGLEDSRSIEIYVPRHVGYETVAQKKTVGVPSFTDEGHSTQLLQTHGCDDNNSFHNGKDPDDVLRESSPGYDVGEDFDVLVDSELRDSKFYHGEDQYGRRGQDGRNSVNEYDPDFNAVADGDAEAFRDHRGFDPYDHMLDRKYVWGHHRASSERGDHLERRTYSTDERSDHIPESDLRLRLSKHRKVNGLRSVVGRDYAPDHSEQCYADSRRETFRESSISSRLQGRIKLPGRVNGDDAHFERGTQWGRNKSQLSQGRQGRLSDRIKGRLEENYCGDQERGSCAPWTGRREMEDNRSSEFPAPKRLAELKSSKEESKAEPLLRKRKSLENHRHQESEDSFAAPLPLSEILKRKRASASVSGGSSDEKDITVLETKQEARDGTIAKERDGDEPKPTAEEVAHGQSDEAKGTHEPKTDEGTMVEEGMAEDQTYEIGEDQAYEGMAEDQAYEGDEQNGEYYYEQGYEEDGEYNYEEGENAEGVEEEYAEEGVEAGGEREREGEEEEEGNEFAKKIGVMF